MALRITPADRIDAVEEALALLDEAAELLRNAQPTEYIRRTVLAQLEGREGGWLGEHVRDLVANWLAELEAEAPDADDGEADPSDGDAR
jgi:hypothetical protein